MTKAKIIISPSIGFVPTTCQYIGEDEIAPSCTSKVVKGQSYCSEHYDVCYYSSTEDELDKDVTKQLFDFDQAEKNTQL